MKLIKINEKHFIIVDSSEINIGDWIFYPVTKAILRWDGNMPLRHEDLKITHSTEPLNKIFNDWFDVQIISLSEIEELIYGYSIEKMADNYTSNERHSGWWAFIRGFKAHQELVKDKLFTIEDMENMFILGGKHKIQNPDKFLEKMKEIIQSLLPKTEWDVKFDKDKLILS